MADSSSGRRIRFGRFVAASTRRAREVAVSGLLSPQTALLLHLMGEMDEDGHCHLTPDVLRGLGIDPRVARARVIVPMIEAGVLLPCSFARCIVAHPLLFQQAYRSGRPCPFEREHQRLEAEWSRRKGDA